MGSVFDFDALAKNTMPVNPLAQARRKSRRVKDYMVQNYDALESELSRTRIDWTVVMAVVRSLGLVDQRGGPASPATVARTWRKVSIDVTAWRSAPRKPANRWRDAMTPASPNRQATVPNGSAAPEAPTGGDLDKLRKAFATARQHSPDVLWDPLDDNNGHRQ